MSESDKLKYDNPRGIPENWVNNYLNREPRQLALDVMRAFDENWKLQRKLDIAKWKVWTLLLVVAGEGVVLGWLVKFVLANLSH